jgi:cysteine desulfurase
MIYADFNGSAPLHPTVVEYLQKRLVNGPYANPNAIHSLGRKVLFGLEKCRNTCAKTLGADPKQISFNSGASEGITHVFHSELMDRKDQRRTIVTSGIEHSAVVNACNYYADRGYKVLKVNSLSNGQVDYDHFEVIATENKNDIALVSIMSANNETGVIQPWEKIAAFCNKHDLIFFSDTTQYIGKTDFNFINSNMDYAVLSGHKIGALVGSGILLTKDPDRLKPLIFGGGQENGSRGGTQNYIGAETLAVALDIFDKFKSSLADVEKRREQFELNIKKACPSVVVVGSDAPRLASTTMIALPGLHGQAVQIELESNDIFVTTSSACSDNEPETSKVLKSMGIDDSVGRGVIRVSFCINTPEEKFLEVEKALINAYKKLEKIHSF